jgi:hypothetical protein
MIQLVNLCKDENIGLNDLMYLYCLNSKEDYNALGVKNVDVMILANKGFLDEDFKITQKSLNVLKDVDLMFKKNTKGPKQMKESDTADFINMYREMWPARVLPSGKPARVSKNIITDCFKWFFTNYDYSWDVVLEATARYLDVQEKDNYRLCRTSQYFIVKTTQERIKESVLADYCELILSGDEEENVGFKQRVV